MIREIRVPFLIVNPKAYIYGQESLELALVCDRLAKEYDTDIIFTAQHADLRMIHEAVKNVILTAQHVDGIHTGRGMGHILPESIKSAGAQAVILNHAEHQLTLSQLSKALVRAKELELLTIVCADTPEESAAVAQLGPDIVICEPTSLIGTGTVSGDDYILATNQAVQRVDPSIKVIQAAGVSTGEDVYRVILEGAHGSGGTSGILNAPSREGKIIEMLKALKRARQELKDKKLS